MTKPVRLQLSRRKGFDLQQLSKDTNGLPAVNVARPGPWGNPWRIGEPGIPTAAEAVRRFRSAVHGFTSNGSFCPPHANPDSYIGRIIHESPMLRGKNLACWCGLPKPGEPDICHAAVLLEIASR
jgi:hypothetical protein